MLTYRNSNIGFVAVIFLFIFLWFFDLLSLLWLALPVLLYISLLVMGAVFIRWNFYTKSINKLSENNKLLLSFDDGPHPLHTLPILDKLDEYGIKAIFFVIGKEAEKYPDLMKEICQRGHLIGNHSYQHHYRFDLFSVENMISEVNRTNQLIKNICGKDIVYFRPPFGVTNPRIHRLLRHTGMLSVGWSFRSFDTTARSNERIVKKIISEIHGGEILLFHDRVERTLDILNDVLPVLTKKFEFIEMEKFAGYAKK